MKRRFLLPAVVAVVVVTAGCTGFGGIDSPSTNEPATTEPGNLPDAGAVTADALAASRNVETYRVNATVNSTRITDRDGTTTVRPRNESVRAEFDRVDRRHRINKTRWYALDRTQTSETERSKEGSVSEQIDSKYLVDSTLYQYTPQSNRESDSAWTKHNLSFTASDYWNTTDLLGQQRAILNASDVTVTSTATVDGVETYVLEANASDTDVAVLDLNQGTVPVATSDMTVRGSYRFYVATESGRLLKSVTDVNVTFPRDTGLQQKNLTATFRFDYDSNVTITLPQGAEDAQTRGVNS